VGLRIFETDPDAQPKEFVREIVGRFRSGRTEGRRPVALDTWRVTTGDPEVASAIANMFGGTVEEWDTASEDNLEVLTDADRVEIIVDGPGAIQSDLKLWGMGGVVIHHCDGVYYLDEDQEGQPCGCPPLFADRKAAAKAGKGPKPDIRVRFRLADAPELGTFEMRSSSWDMARVVHMYEDALEGVGGPALVALALETVSFVPKGGPMKGRTVSYKRPSLTVKGAAPSVGAEAA